MPPQTLGFLRGFSLKTGVHFAHLDLEMGMVFEGTTGVYARIYCFNREEKSLRHVAKVATFLDDNKPKRHLRIELAELQTSSNLFNFI